MAADYGNWVSRRLVYAPLALGVLILIPSILFPFLLAFSAILLLVSGYSLYARCEFGRGGVQEKIIGLVLEKLDWQGEGDAIDIGCGNGALTVRLARAKPTSRVTGVDVWDGGWEYSKEACEKNAESEGVGARVGFQKASATALPFEDGRFDVATSNLVFHEVKGIKDKKKVIQEALRVVKKGGKFAFQDLFLMKSEFGTPDELIAAVRRWGVTKVEFTPTKDAPFIPRLLKLPFMVGTLAIISGEK
jgi:SAM-dependent methyltransferase